MVHTILKRKIGTLGRIVVIVLILVVGLLWIIGKPESEAPEIRETVAMKIPKPEPEVSASDFSPQLEDEHAVLPEALEPEERVIEPGPIAESLETAVEMQEAMDIPEVSIKAMEINPEESVPAATETPLAQIEDDVISAAEDPVPQAADLKDSEENSVDVSQKRTAEKKTALIQNPQEEENTGVDLHRAAQEFALQDIRLSENMKGKVLEVWAGHTITKYRYFILSNPPRLVIDLPGKWKEPDFRIKAIGNDLISGIRLWRHDSKLRIVSDLTSNQRINPVVSPNSEGVEFLLITE